MKLITIKGIARPNLQRSNRQSAVIIPLKQKRVRNRIHVYFHLQHIWRVTKVRTSHTCHEGKCSTISIYTLYIYVYNMQRIVWFSFILLSLSLHRFARLRPMAYGTWYLVENNSKATQNEFPFSFFFICRCRMFLFLSFICFIIAIHSYDILLTEFRISWVEFPNQFPVRFDYHNLYLCIWWTEAAKRFKCQQYTTI